jgi:hypothetical protein
MFAEFGLLTSFHPSRDYQREGKCSEGWFWFPYESIMSLMKWQFKRVTYKLSSFTSLLICPVLCINSSSSSCWLSVWLWRMNYASFSNVNSPYYLLHCSRTEPFIHRSIHTIYPRLYMDGLTQSPHTSNISISYLAFTWVEIIHENPTLVSIISIIVIILPCVCTLYQIFIDWAGRQASFELSM